MLLKISMPRSQIFEALAKLKKPPIDVAAEIPFAAQRAFDKNKALMGMAPPPKGNFSPSSSKTLRTIVAELSAMDSLRLLQQLERPSMEEKLYDPQPRNKDMMGGPIGMAKMYSDNSVSKPSATMEKPISIEELLKRKPNVKVPELKAVEALKQVLSRAKHGALLKQSAGTPFPSVAQHILPYPPNGGNPLLRPGPFGTGVHPDTSQKTEDDGIPPYLKMQLADTVGDVITAIMRSKGA